MTKQEILEAIDSTIVANDKKAITAESLANILREMVTATPEGGGSVEFLQLYFGDTYELYPTFSIPVFTPTGEKLNKNIELYNTIKNSESLNLIVMDMCELYPIMSEGMMTIPPEVKAFTIISNYAFFPKEFLVTMGYPLDEDAVMFGTEDLGIMFLLENGSVLMFE